MGFPAGRAQIGYVKRRASADVHRSHAQRDAAAVGKIVVVIQGGVELRSAGMVFF